MNYFQVTDAVVSATGRSSDLQKPAIINRKGSQSNVE